MSVRDVISIFYPDSKARLGELVVDAFIREIHEFGLELSEHPMESGSSIVDHAHNEPLCVSVEGIISNTPMNLMGLTAFDSVVQNFQGQSNDFAMTAFNKIEELFETRKLISIATSLKTYDQMILESLTIERGGGFYSESLHFACTARQIQTANQKRIKFKQKRGLQETKPIPKAQAEAIKSSNSLLFSLVGG